MSKKIRVLVVDDSFFIRKILGEGLSQDPEIEVVGTAADAYEARDMIEEHNPDMITLDIILPGMTGIKFLKKLMDQHPMPVLMVSALTEHGKKITLDALALGAYDFVTKPIDIEEDVDVFVNEVVGKVKMLPDINQNFIEAKQSKDELQELPEMMDEGGGSLPDLSEKVIGIGASTGGTEAITQILSELPLPMPGILVAQHMPPVFTKLFADSLNDSCALEVKEAKDGDEIVPNTVYVAPGGTNMVVEKKQDKLFTKCIEDTEGEKFIPSVSKLFHSIAEIVGDNSMGIILTGMGSDGSDGMLAMKNAGGFTLAQDEKTSLVFGMSKSAIDKGAIKEVLPLYDISGRIRKLFHKK